MKIALSSKKGFPIRLKTTQDAVYYINCNGILEDLLMNRSKMFCLTGFVCCPSEVIDIAAGGRFGCSERVRLLQRRRLAV